MDILNDKKIFDEDVKNTTYRLLKDDVYMEVFDSLSQVLKECSSEQIFNALITNVDDETLVKILRELEEKNNILKA